MTRHADRGRSAYLVLGGFLVIAGWIGPARADDVNAAKSAFERGTKSYNMAEFSQALESYKQAYGFKSDPALLFNIAQCHRMLGHTDEAIAVYRAYLREAPDAKNRADVEKRIDELQAQRSIGFAANPTAAPATAPAARPMKEAKAAEPKLAGLDLSHAQTATGATSEPSPTPDVPASSQPFYGRWWFWTAVGAVAAGATIGFLATRDPTHIPSSSLGSRKVLP